MEKGAGVGRLYAEWQKYMSHMGDTPTKIEVDDLLQSYDLTKGSKFLGQLMANIHREKSRRKDAQGARELLEVVRLYCQLSTLREMLLHQMYVLVVNSEGVEGRQSTVRGIKGVLDMQQDVNRKLEFLHLPSMDEVAIASVYNPEEYPEIAQYLHHMGMPAPP